MLDKNWYYLAWLAIKGGFFLLMAFFVGAMIGTLFFAGKLILPAILFLIFVWVVVFCRPCLHLEKYPVLSSVKNRMGKHYHCWNCGRYIN